MPWYGVVYGVLGDGGPRARGSLAMRATSEGEAWRLAEPVVAAMATAAGALRVLSVDPAGSSPWHSSAATARKALGAGPGESLPVSAARLLGAHVVSR